MATKLIAPDYARVVARVISESVQKAIKMITTNCDISEEDARKLVGEIVIQDILYNHNLKVTGLSDDDPVELEPLGGK